MEYVFNHNAQPRVQEQIGKAFDAVIEHTEKTAKLSDAPINKLDFYEPVTLPDGTKLSVNHIKANGNDKLKNCPEEVISVVDAEGNHSFLIANSPENIARANKLKDLMSRIEQPEHLKSVSKVETDISKVQFITKNPKGKNVLTPEGEKIIRMKAEEIHNAAKEAQDGILADMKKAGLIGDEYTVSHRPKSVQSLFDKMKNEMIRDDAPASFETAVKSVRDAVGVRTLLGNLDYKNYPEIAQMLKTDPEKAYKMAAEKQSEIMVDNISQLIKAQAEGNSPIAAMRLTNYSGKDGLPYFSDAQVAYLRDLALENKINLQIKDETTKIRASGYTALQMNFVTKDGFVYEWQLRGKELDLFANAEHIPYDLRENKDITSGNPKLKELYAPIIEAVKMTDAEYAKYNDYLTDHYLSLIHI